MLTLGQPQERENDEGCEGFKPLSAFMGAAFLHNYVNHTLDKTQPEEARPLPTKASGETRKAGSKRRKAKTKSGGWPVQKSIPRETYKQTRHEAVLLHQAGYRAVWFLTIRPPEIASTDRVKKDWLCQASGHFGQALTRNGLPNVRLTVYEKPVGGYLHAHVVVFLPAANLLMRKVSAEVVRGWADKIDSEKPGYGPIDEPSVDKHARPADFRAVNYALKQHRPAQPEVEKRRGGWQKSEPIRGTRVSWSTSAKAVIQEAEQPIVRPTERPKPRLALVSESQQLSLFGDAREAKPVARLHDFGGGMVPAAVAREIRFLAARHGVGITALAHAAHIAQPTLSNALDGRFPLSPWAARRIREILLSPRLPMRALAA